MMIRHHAREREIARLRAVERLTLKEIGDRYGISTERVRQLLNHYYSHLGQSHAMSQLLGAHPTAMSVIARLRAEGPKRDEHANQRAAELTQAQQPLNARERSKVFRDAPIAVSEEVASLLYILARTRCGRVVELGGSLGVSTIHLAAGVKDSSRHGSVLSTELDPVKARALTINLHRAGLKEIVEVRAGDAQDTLADLDGPPIDLLFLDGWNEHYLPVLKLLEDHLAPDALVLADLSTNDPALHPYLDHVHNTHSQWHSITLPLNAGVELSIRAREPTHRQPPNAETSP